MSGRLSSASKKRDILGGQLARGGEWSLANHGITWPPPCVSCIGMGKQATELRLPSLPDSTMYDARPRQPVPMCELHFMTSTQSKKSVGESACWHSVVLLPDVGIYKSTAPDSVCQSRPTSNKHTLIADFNVADYPKQNRTNHHKKQHQTAVAQSTNLDTMAFTAR